MRRAKLFHRTRIAETFDAAGEAPPIRDDPPAGAETSVVITNHPRTRRPDRDAFRPRRGERPPPPRRANKNSTVHASLLPQARPPSVSRGGTRPSIARVHKLRRTRTRTPSRRHPPPGRRGSGGRNIRALLRRGGEHLHPDRVGHRPPTTKPPPSTPSSPSSPYHETPSRTPRSRLHKYKNLHFIFKVYLKFRFTLRTFRCAPLISCKSGYFPQPFT